MKNIMVWVFTGMVLLLVSVVVFIFATAHPVPKGTGMILEEVLSHKLPEQIEGDSGRALSGEIAIWYESIQPMGLSKGTILLIMGLGGNALEWPLYFTRPLVDSGYQVIRFDNRSTGLSSWTEKDFSLENMANDALNVMNELGIDSAHVVGMSMGGMIGQLLAISHPERVQTLTSFMSSGFTEDPDLPGISRTKFVALITTGIRHGLHRTERNLVRTTVSVRSVLAPELSEERIRALAEQSLYNERFRKGFNPRAFIQHTKAIRKSGSRYEGLRKLSIPTLVIHGKQDPLIPSEHGIKTARVIPDAKLLLVEGMGHDISPDHTQQIHKAILELFRP